MILRTIQAWIPFVSPNNTNMGFLSFPFLQFVLRTIWSLRLLRSSQKCAFSISPFLFAFFFFPCFPTSFFGPTRFVRVGSRCYRTLLMSVFRGTLCRYRCRFFLAPDLRVGRCRFLIVPDFRVLLERVGWHMSLIRL